MKIVLDTNVLVAGLLNSFGAPGEIVRMVSSGTLELYYDARILSEYLEVLLRPKFEFEKSAVEALLEEIKVSGHPVAADPLPFRLPDLDDEAFLEVAITGGAKYLVTGNVKHYPTSKLSKVPSVQMLSPSEFLDIYRKL